LESKNKSYNFYILIFVAATLRFYTLGSYGITADELSALQRTEFNSFLEMINKGVLIDFHPPLVQTFLYYWCKMFGTTEFSVRLPFAIVSILSIYLYYQIAEKWFNKNVALLSAAAIACNQLMIIYSRLARPYAFGIFFTAAAALYFTKIIVDKKLDLKTCALYVFYCWCAMNTHYFSFLFIAVLGLISLFLITKQNAKAILLSGLAMLVLFIPTIFILKHQLDAGGIGSDSGGWLWLPDFNFIIDYIKYIFNGSRYLMIFLFTLILYFVSQSKGQTNSTNFIVRKLRIASLLIWLFPIVFGYIYSYAKNPILQHSVLSFSLPFLFIFLFSFIPDNFSKKIVSISFASIIIITTSISVFANDFYNTNFFGVYKPIAERTIEWEAKYGKQNITHLINTDNPFFINYYYKQWKKKVDYKGYNFVGNESLKEIVEIVKNSKTKYFSFAWTNIASPLEINEIIKTKYPYLIDRKFFFNSEYFLYSKEKGNSNINDVEFNLFTDFNKDIGLFKNNDQCYSFIDGIDSSRCIELNCNFEYSPGIEVNANEFYRNEYSILNLSAMVRKLEIDAKAELVVQFKNNDSISSWQGMNTSIFTKDTTNWHRVYFSLSLPKNSLLTDKLNIYFWNTSKKRMLFDDFRITITNGNPGKYSINKNF